MKEFNEPEVIVKTDQNQEVLTLAYDNESKIGYANWKWKDYGTENIIKGGTAMVEFAKKYKIEKFLNDNREVEGNWDSANEWVQETWIPNMVAAGVRRLAMILSPEIYSQLSAELLVDAAEDSPFHILSFQSFDDAMAWLKKQ